MGLCHPKQVLHRSRRGDAKRNTSPGLAAWSSRSTERETIEIGIHCLYPAGLM